MLTETWRNLITLPWTQIYSGTKVHKFQECIKMCSHFQIVSETLTFRFRHFMAQPCRADSPHRVFNTVELLHTDMQTCFMFQTRDGSHAAEIPLADRLPLVRIRDGLCILGLHVFYSFRCFQRVPCGISRIDSSNPHQLGTRFS